MAILDNFYTGTFMLLRLQLPVEEGFWNTLFFSLDWKLCFTWDAWVLQEIPPVSKVSEIFPVEKAGIFSVSGQYIQENVIPLLKTCQILKCSKGVATSSAGLNQLIGT